MSEKEKTNIALQHTEKGKIILNLENACLIMSKHPYFKGKLKYNEFSKRLRIKDKDGWRDVEDIDFTTIQRMLSRVSKEFSTVNLQTATNALFQTCHNNSYDPMIEYLESLTWDGVSRLDSWLHKVYKCEDNELHAAFGSNWLKALVKRQIEPGFKFDYVLVIEGGQGIGKSSAFGILGNIHKDQGQIYHHETSETPEGKDFFMSLLGHTIFEFSEGESMTRVDVKKLKAIITMQNDHFRAPYDRVFKTHPRRNVFAMTTNHNRYLKDETGNRRWWPVHSPLDNEVKGELVDFKWLEENRDQLYAEAYHRVTVLNETCHEVPADLAREAQEERQVVDSTKERVLDWYLSLDQKERDAGVSPVEIWKHQIWDNEYHNAPQIPRREESIIIGTLTNVLKLRQERRRQEGGARPRRYYPSASTPPMYVDPVDEVVEENLSKVKTKVRDIPNLKEFPIVKGDKDGMKLFKLQRKFHDQYESDKEFRFEPNQDTWRERMKKVMEEVERKNKELKDKRK